MGYEHTDDKHPDFPMVTNGEETVIFNRATEESEVERPKLKPLMFGYRNVPDNLRAAWGARLIWPNDFVHDRQDLVALDDEAREALVHWLNNGAINKMREALRTPARLGLSPKHDNEVVIIEDERGKIIGSTQASSGYVYVVGWIKEHKEA